MIKYILALSLATHESPDNKVYWPVAKRPYITYASIEEAERARSNLQLFYMGKLYVIDEDHAFTPSNNPTFGDDLVLLNDPSTTIDDDNE